MKFYFIFTLGGITKILIGKYYFHQFNKYKQSFSTEFTVRFDFVP